jgi:hypothetical protein
MASVPVCDNKKMTLSDARLELEQRGFKIVVDPNGDDYTSAVVVENGDGNNYNNSDTLVGYHSQCVSYCSYKVDTMIFVFQIKKGESLTLNRINYDLDNYVAQKQNDIYDNMIGLSNTCPPQGFSRARMVIAIYYADMIDNDAMDKIFATPTRQWCGNTFLAVQNTTTGSSSFMENTTPIWGRVFYPEIRYWAGLLTGRIPRPQPDLPPSSRPPYQRFVEGYLLVLVIYMLFFSDDIYTKIFMLGNILLLLLIAVIMWLCHRRRCTMGKRTDGNERLL